jgi:hypothetical protein
VTPNVKPVFDITDMRSIRSSGQADLQSGVVNLQ